MRKAAKTPEAQANRNAPVMAPVVQVKNILAQASARDERQSERVRSDARIAIAPQ
jgi:hypothetical protein